MATQEARLVALAQALGDDFTLVVNYIFGAGNTLANLTTTNKASILAALNELKGRVDAAGSGLAINDADADGDLASVYSSTKTLALIAAAQTAASNAAVAQITASAPAVLDTLNEIALALGNDPNFSTTIMNGLANRLRFDAAQTLTAPQKVQANTNLGSVSLVQVGNPDADLLAAYTAAKL